MQLKILHHIRVKKGEFIEHMSNITLSRYTTKNENGFLGGLLPPVPCTGQAPGLRRYLQIGLISEVQVISEGGAILNISSIVGATLPNRPLAKRQAGFSVPT